MCRIAGIYSPSLPLTDTRVMVEKMCGILKHGGPDDEGFYAAGDRSLVLGHRRLALIDLSPGGHQPMSYNDGKIWISYNGELYNYLELKATLEQAGYRFHSSSDTEVILAAYSAWGSNAFRRFNGMFAFALWDRDKKKLLLVRDPGGIKPLYFAITNEGLAFASEVRGFSVLPWLQEEDPHWPVYMLAYGHIPEPVTTLKNVRPLPKGCYMEYSVESGKWDIESFAHYTYLEKEGDREIVKTSIRNLLQLSVQRHLLSDAPIGVFLSGGLDSSILAILAAKYHTAALKTLSIVFEEEKYSEKKYQDLVIEKIQCQNWQEVLSENIFQEKLPDIIQAMDMPGCDGINTWFISKCAKDSGLKAVLSGIGGDELFGGYPSFRRIDKVSWIEKMPAALLRSGRYAGSRKLRRIAYLSLGGAKGYYLFLRGQFIPAEIAAQLNINEDEVWRILEEQPVLPHIGSLSEGNQASWIEMNLYMQNQLLRDADVMSMAHGIEIRVPFLDKDFVQMAMNIRSVVKYAGEKPKQLLIDSFKTELPEGVWNRPKMGFAFPFAEWMAKNDLVKATMNSQGGAGTDSYNKFINGQMHWSQLMSLLLLRLHRNEK